MSKRSAAKSAGRRVFQRGVVIYPASMASIPDLPPLYPLSRSFTAMVRTGATAANVRGLAIVRDSAAGETVTAEAAGVRAAGQVAAEDLRALTAAIR